MAPRSPVCALLREHLYRAEQDKALPQQRTQKALPLALRW
jgi:hypothetical protein